MGLGLGGLKKWFDDTAGTVGNGVAAGYHGFNVFDGSQGFTTRQPVQQPGQRTIFQRGWDQVNGGDNGRTWQNANPTNDRSLFGQATHNGLTNLVGNLTYKPVANTILTGWDAGKMLGDHLAGAPLQQQYQDSNNLASHWHGSIPGFLADQGINAGRVAQALPQAVMADIHGFQGHAPTPQEQDALNRGLQALNQTVPGQMVSPAEALIADHVPGAREAAAAGGYHVDATGAQKFIGDPVMGVAGTYGLLKGGEMVAKKAGGQTIPLNQSGGVRVGQSKVEQLRQQNAGAGTSRADQLNNVMVAAQESPRLRQPNSLPKGGVTEGLDYQGLRNKMILAKSGVRPLNQGGYIRVAGGEKLPAKQSPVDSLPNDTSEFASQIQNRGFIDTIFNDHKTPIEVKQALTDLDTSYMTRNTKQLQIKAANLVKTHRDVAQQLANNAHDDISVAVGSELIKSLQKEGNYTAAIDTAMNLAKNLTEAGRMVQAASIYAKLTPEGILRFAQSEINKYNKATGKKVALDPTAAEKLVKMSEDIQKMPEGMERAQATAQLVAEVHRQMPTTLAEKLGTLQTMAQLLNLKTNVRNVGGNAMFGGLENVSQMVGTGLDKLLSLKTGERTTGLPSIKVQAKGFVEGGKTGIKEAKMGINTGPTSQFELNSVPVFRGKILGTLEKTMNGTLRGADRAAYKAAFDDTIHSLQKVNKTDKVTPDMLEQAHHTAMYRTFQDSNAVSDFFVGMKKSLNKVGIGTEGKRFGLGDLVLKYPKTPGNLLARGIDYSPAGFLKALYEGTKPLFGREFNQKAFVDDFSRATVGSTSAFAVGYAMADAGIITAQPSQNKDLRNVQKTTGLGGYQINVSGLKRWVGSGFNKDEAKLQKGDTLVSYDWAQPIAIPMSAGAALGSKQPVKVGAANTSSGVINSVNTLAEQPLLTGVQRLFGGYGGISDAVTNTLTSAPASFVPTAVSQANQLIDNKARVVTADNPFSSAVNQVKAKVPGLAQTLPVQYDVLGNPKERYQDGGNTPFNVLANPAFVSHYNPQASSGEVLRLYQNTGETKQTPNTAPTSIKVTGADGKLQTIKLTGQKQSDYQQFTGKMTDQQIQQLLQDPNYQTLPDSEKVKILSGKQTDINNAAKVKVGGDNPKDISTGTASILAGGNNVQLAAASANEKVAVQKFTSSKDKMMEYGNTLYYKSGDGSVKSMPKAEYQFNITNAQLNLDMDRAQASNDFGSWMGLAEKQYNALEQKKQLYDPGTESDKIAAITLQQENLMQKAQKYQEYGGFKKGSAGAKGLPSIDVSIPSSLSNPVVSSSSYTAPKNALRNKGSVRVGRRASVKLKVPKKLA